MADEWFAVVDENGELRSVGTVLGELPEGWRAIDVGPDRPEGNWDPVDEIFVEQTPNPDEAELTRLLEHARDVLSGPGGSDEQKMRAATFLELHKTR